MSSVANESFVCDAQKWVKNLFEDTDIDIPDLEGNYDCMKLISNIISLNKEAEKDAEEIIKTESYLADYYMRKSDNISSSFDSEISMKDLHPDVAENVKKIAFVATQLKLKEPTITNFLLSSSALNSKKECYIEQEMINGFTLSKFSKKITDIIKKNSILERDIEIFERKISRHLTVNSEMQEKSKFFRVKGEEYKKRIKTQEKQLRNLGWNSSLSHSKLVKRSEAIQCLQDKVNNLSSKLESYENLPPNEMLTRLKIEETQAELLQLQNEFDNLLEVTY